MTWTIRPGSWKGFYHVEVNGVSLGQFSAVNAADALALASYAFHSRTLAPFYQERADAVRLAYAAPENRIAA
jgi:hypothetical protein